MVLSCAKHQKNEQDMNEQARRARLLDEMRDHVLTDPGLILEDPEMMKALIAANERIFGENIVDLRGVAMKRLETRLDRLEDTHRSVIAAAYENLAGANIVQRAVLQMLEPAGFTAFLAAMGNDVAATLRVDSLRLVLESHEASTNPGLGALSKVVQMVPAGFVEDYLTKGRSLPLRRVTLRQVSDLAGPVHGDKAADLRSEAVLLLDLGAGRLPAMLVLGSEDPHQFRPAQGTDLLGFFGSVFERLLRRWLA
jgi:uncharacterized protein